MKKIPLFDLTRQNKKYKTTIIKKISQIIDHNQFTHGPDTNEFEEKFAQLCNTKYAVGVHSGTDALILSLKALGINPGDEVITTPCTFSATADSIIHVGATPVFVDVSSQTGNIDPSAITKKITKKTKCILLVHLYGVPCDMDEILQIAKKHSLKIIEDASHAHGSLYKNKPVGSFGSVACFSLYPSKSLGAFGNAGVITTNSKTVMRRVRMYANHGIKSFETKYTHHVHGFNKLIDNLQSATILPKLEQLSTVIEKKRSIANQYNAAFQSIGLVGMFWQEDARPSIYVYAFQTKNRKKVRQHFESHGIATGIYYPTPLHFQPSMKHLSHKKGNFPNAEAFFKQTLSLPIFAELTTSEISHIVDTIKKIVIK